MTYVRKPLVEGRGSGSGSGSGEVGER